MGEPVGRRAALLALSSGAVAASQNSGPRVGTSAVAGNGVDPADFGARYDGISDDSAAMQRAVDACITGAQWRELVISGPLLLTRSIMIDRPVDRSVGVFQIRGEAGGHIIGKGVVPLFDSHLPMRVDPVSEYVRLSNLSISGAGGSIFSRKFLRLQMDACFVKQMRLVDTEYYIQSFEITRSRFVGDAGKPIVLAKEGYEITISNSHFERTGRVIDIGNMSGISIIGNIFESCSTAAISIDGVNGMVFNGNYTEQNQGPTIVLGVKLGRSCGVSIFGNNLKGLDGEANKDKYEIILGRAEGVASGGNYCGGNLYDTGYVRLGGLRSMADAAQGRLTSSDYPFDVVPAGLEPPPAIIDFARIKTAEIPAVSAPVTIIRNVANGSNQVLLPVSVSDGCVRKVTLVNEGPAALIVQPAARGSFLPGGKPASNVVAPGSARSFLEYERGRWCAL